MQVDYFLILADLCHFISCLKADMQYAYKNVKKTNIIGSGG